MSSYGASCSIFPRRRNHSKRMSKSQRDLEGRERAMSRPNRRDHAVRTIAPRPPASARQHDPEAILRRLEWTVIRRLDGLLQGDYRTLFRGFGLDLADLREYQYHDDVR